MYTYMYSIYIHHTTVKVLTRGDQVAVGPEQCGQERQQKAVDKLRNSLELEDGTDIPS
jgi:hypothetical protein